MANDSFADHLNVILVGDGASGKTQLVRVLTGRDFLDDYSVSVVETTEFKTMLPRKKPKEISISFIDLAGQENYKDYRKPFYDTANVFLVCYEICRVDSFKNVFGKWIDEIKSKSEGYNCPMILCGLKSDLKDNNPEEFVTTKEGKEKAEEFGFVSFVECSAKNQYEEIDNSVQNVLKEILKATVQIKEKSGKNCFVL